MTWMAASRDMMVHSVLEDKADRVCEKAASAAQVEGFFFPPAGRNWSRK